MLGPRQANPSQAPLWPAWQRTDGMCSLCVSCSAACCLTSLMPIPRDFPLNIRRQHVHVQGVFPKLKKSTRLERYQGVQTPYTSHGKPPWERLSPGITQASTGWKELEAQPVVVRSRTGGDVNGACTLYKHPASDRLSHIGCQETTAEAANHRKCLRIYHHGSRIKQRQGSPRFDQNEFCNSK